MFLAIHSSGETRTPGRSGFTLVELLVVIAIIGILVALLLPAVQSAREAARRASCQNNLKNVALAVLTYESSYSRLPQGMTFDGVISGSVGNLGTFVSSWTIDILPQMEQQPLYDQINRALPIADASNAAIRATEIPSFLCPSDAYNAVKFDGAGDARRGGLGTQWARGNYAANAGANALANLRLGPSLSGATQPGMTDGSSFAWRGGLESDSWPTTTRGVIAPNASSRLAQIVDGTSHTMMLAEIRAGIIAEDPRGVWALAHAGGNMVAGHGSGGDDNGPNACNNYADDVPTSGSLISFSCAASEDLLAPECMRCNSDPFGFAQATARSMHVGGVFIARADGSVDFIEDEIETSGEWGSCCKAWDYLIMAADEGYTPADRRR